MLEIPEVNTLAQQWNETIKGKTITKVIAGKAPHGFTFFFEEKDEYSKFLNNKVCGTAKAYGGILEITIEDYVLTFGDGTNLRYYQADAKKPEKHQLFLAFQDDSALVVTVQMYGFISVFKPGENDNFYYLTAKEKPSPLKEDFDIEYFQQTVTQAKSEKPNLSLKGLLATEQRIPGLGNGCVQDILFSASQHPKSKVSKLNEKDFEKLFRSVKEVLQKMVNQGGRNTEKDLFGNSGGYRCLLSAKTYKEPCPVCQGTIVRQAFLGGNVYFCNNCQIERK